MILSAQTIVARNLVEPMVQRSSHRGMTYGLSPCGYDVRVRETVTIAPQHFVLLSTLERFDIPWDICAFVCDKSTWARQGLALQNTILEPGWRGYATLEATNHGDQVLSLQEGDPIAQVVFCTLDHPTILPYDGKYQDQPPQPVSARLTVSDGGREGS